MGPRTRMYVKGYGFYHLRENIRNKKDVSKKVVDQAGEYLENKITDAVSKLNNDNIEKQEPVEEITIH